MAWRFVIDELCLFLASKACKFAAGEVRHACKVTVIIFRPLHFNRHVFVW